MRTSHQPAPRVALTALLSLAALAGAACTDVDAQRADWSMIQDRLWIERMPKDERDLVKQLVLLDDDGERVGAAMRCSRFRFLVDLVTWSGRGDRLVMSFLQAREKRSATVRAWSCKGKAPAPFELCLELADGDARRTYYSMREWVIDDLDAATAPGAPWQSSVPAPDAPGDGDLLY